MPDYRVTFVEKDGGQPGSRKWASEIEARAFIAGLWRGGTVTRVRLLQIEAGKKPVALAVRAGGAKAVAEAEAAHA